jgi:hypothetical protein
MQDGASSRASFRCADFARACLGRWAARDAERRPGEHFSETERISQQQAAAWPRAARQGRSGRIAANIAKLPELLGAETKLGTAEG